MSGPARGVAVGTVIIGRPCRTVGGGPSAAPGGAAAAAKDRHPLLHDASGAAAVQRASDALASTHPARIAECVAPISPAIANAAWLEPFHLRVTRSLGVAASEDAEAGAPQVARARASARVQSLSLERAAAEARHQRARRARRRRSASRLGPLAVSSEPPSVPSRAAPGALRRLALAALAALGAIALLALGVLALAASPASLRAPGVLLGGASHFLEPMRAGVVKDVLLRPGSEVTPGQLLLRLESADATSTLGRRERELDALRRDTARVARADAASLAEWAAAIERQRSALARRRDTALARHAGRARNLERDREAVAEGLLRAEAAEAARDGVHAAEAGIAALDERLAALAVNLAERRHDAQLRELERERALERARAAVEEARASLALAEVRSPVAGRVASVLVTPGERARPGVPLAEVVPAGALRSLVAFVPSRDAQRVHAGMAAHVALEAAHAFGGAPARVTRMLPSDGHETLAPLSRDAHATPFVAVELALLDAASSDALAASLPSGARVRVHLHAERPGWQRRLRSLWRG